MVSHGVATASGPQAHRLFVRQWTDAVEVDLSKRVRGKDVAFRFNVAFNSARRAYWRHERVGIVQSMDC